MEKWQWFDELSSIITCPECGYMMKEKIPIGACQYFYDCDAHLIKILDDFSAS